MTNKTQPRILFAGMNDLGKRVLSFLGDRDENVVGVIRSKHELECVERLQPDMLISCGYRHIIPSDVLEQLPMGAINFHKAMLPYNRGAHPNVWSIIDDKPVGVSLHYMDSGIDTGPVIAQQRVPVKFEDNAKTLYERMEEAQHEMFTNMWDDIRTGNVTATPQTNKGTYHTKQEFRDMKRLDLDKTQRVGDTIDLLRAMTFPPYENLHVDIDGQRYNLELKVTRGERT